jgi:hypothetical protein
MFVIDAFTTYQQKLPNNFAGKDADSSLEDRKACIQNVI